MKLNPGCPFESKFPHENRPKCAHSEKDKNQNNNNNSDSSSNNNIPQSINLK